MSKQRYVDIDNVVYHLDDIGVDKDGKCDWTDVANALTHIKLCIEPPGVERTEVQTESAYKCLAICKAACAWPDCGCDPHATKVIAALVDQGWIAPPECRGAAQAGPGPREVLDALADKVSAKIGQLEHYKAAGAQLDHAKTIAEGRVLQANQILHWIAEAAVSHSPSVPSAEGKSHD